MISTLSIFDSMIRFFNELFLLLKIVTQYFKFFISFFHYQMLIQLFNILPIFFFGCYTYCVPYSFFISLDVKLWLLVILLASLPNKQVIIFVQVSSLVVKCENDFPFIILIIKFKVKIFVVNQDFVTFFVLNFILTISLFFYFFLDNILRDG